MKLDVVKGNKYATVVTENKALKKEVEELKKENERVMKIAITEIISKDQPCDDFYKAANGGLYWCFGDDSEPWQSINSLPKHTKRAVLECHYGKKGGK